MKLLPVVEIFASYQGEGMLMGRPVSFLRLAGCPIRCKFCDTPQAQKAEDWPKMSEEEIVELVAEHRLGVCVITGGEPAIHDLTRLTRKLAQRGIWAAIETSGAFPLPGFFRWVTVSPKNRPLELRTAQQANEFKLVVTKGMDVVQRIEELGLILAPQDRRPIWLHPEWSQRDLRCVHKAIENALEAFPLNCRIGCQLHKFYGDR